METLIAKMREYAGPLQYRDEAAMLRDISRFVGHAVTTLDELTLDEATNIVTKLERSMDMLKRNQKAV